MDPSAIYSNAIISTYESKLLGENRIRRMIAATCFSEAARVLFECGYDENAILNSGENEDLIINKELSKTVALFKKLCPDKNLVQCVLAKYFEDARTFDIKPLVKKISNPRIRKFFETDDESFLTHGADVFSLEKILKWVILKQRELKTVKTILMGRKLGMSRERIRELLRSVK